jgi:hypothetical protein
MLKFVEHNEHQLLHLNVKGRELIGGLSTQERLSTRETLSEICIQKVKGRERGKVIELHVLQAGTVGSKGVTWDLLQGCVHQRSEEKGVNC